MEVKVNGIQVLNHAGPRSSGSPGTIHDRVPVSLIPGGNLIQFKVFNGCCDWGVRARFEGDSTCGEVDNGPPTLEVGTTPLPLITANGPGTRTISAFGETMVDVILQLNNQGMPYSLRESLGSGWTVAGLSGGGQVNGNTIVWDQASNAILSYRLERSTPYGARQSRLVGIFTLSGVSSLVGGDMQIPGFSLDFVNELLLLPPLNLGGLNPCGIPVEFLEGPWLGDATGITDQNIVPRAGLEFRPDFGGVGSQAVGFSPIQTSADFWTLPADPEHALARMARVAAQDTGEFSYDAIFHGGWGDSVTVGFVYVTNHTGQNPWIVYAGFGFYNPVALRLNGRRLWTVPACPDYKLYGAKYAIPLDPGKNLLSLYSFGSSLISFRFEDSAGAPVPLLLSLDPAGYDPDPAKHPAHPLPPLPTGTYSSLGFVTQFLVPARPFEEKWQGNTQPGAVPEDYITIDGAVPTAANVHASAATGPGSTGRITTAVRGAPSGKTELVLFDGIAGPAANSGDPGLFDGMRFYSNPKPNYSTSLFCFLDNRSSSDVPITLGFASDDAATLFLNGERIGQHLAIGSYGPANTIEVGPLPAVARPGLNLVQLSYNDGGGASGARLQMLSACTGRPLDPWQVAVFAEPPPRSPFVMEIRPAGRRSVAVVLDSTLPVRGGELGLAYDPSGLARLRIKPGSDLPSEAQVFFQEHPRTSCAPELSVEAGVTLSWINSVSSSPLIPAGRHELFRITYSAVNDAAVGNCSPLRFVTCLGDPTAPIQNVVTTEDLSSVPFVAQAGQACVNSELPFQRGDANGDGRFDITDPIVILGCLFLGTPCPLCPDASDVDDTGKIDISDPVYLLNWRFGVGDHPPLPFPDCDLDASIDDLEACESAPLCG